jgi:type IV secretory pathway TrbD component
METTSQVISKCRRVASSKNIIASTDRGQAVVEFTLVFVLLLVIAWIPADFGLAFFSSQLAANASREGARIGAADPSYSTQVGNCTLPGCFSLADGTILKETANRLSSALLPGATITVDPLSGPTCNQSVQVRVVGTYNFTFYQLLHLMGVTTDLNTQSITRETSMRWEHQC